MKIICATIIAFTVAFSSPTLAVASSKIEKLQKEIIKIQNAGKLGILNLTLCRQINGYSSFIPYDTNVIPRGKTALLYFEPDNLFTSVSKGKYSFSLSEDISIVNSKGKVVLNLPKVVQVSSTSKQPLFDIHLRNSFYLNAPDDYVFNIVLVDELRKTKVKASFKFTVK